MNIQTQDNACMHQCGSLLMRIVVLLKLFNTLYAQLGLTMERIKDSILFYSFAVSGLIFLKKFLVCIK